jgi:riboflavin synthase
MFTGLVAGTGEVQAAQRGPDGLRLSIATPLATELSTGDSIAVNGVCLTAVDIENGNFRADVMEETIGRSTLGLVRPGDAVNLELPLRVGDRLGGHIVQGHVDGMGMADSAEDDGFSRRVRITAPPETLRFIVEKGSIAVNGVSLTVAEVDGYGFTVALIPETLERTTFGSLQPGDVVNLEVDIMAKYAMRA